MMNELAAFLRACWNEEEQVAMAVPVGGPGPCPPAVWGTGSDPLGDRKWVLGTYTDIDAVTPEGATHIARHDPARVVREIAAKRQMLEEAERIWNSRVVGVSNAALNIARLLALPYAGRNGYRSEWRP